MLEKSELRAMYLRKRQELVRFADIRLLAKSWPKHLLKISPFYLQDDCAQAIPISPEVYERWDRDLNPLARDREDRKGVFHSFMVVLRDATGLTLLDCYDGYPEWKQAVANRWMAPEWNIWTIHFDGDFPIIHKLQLALYTHWQRVKLMNLLVDEADMNRCLLEVIKASQFTIGAIQRGRCTRTDLGYLTARNHLEFLHPFECSTLGEIMARCGLNWDEEIIVTVGRTAVALSRNEGFTRFLQDYKKDMDQACEEFKERPGRIGEHMDGFNVFFLNLRSFYYAAWWYRESLPVQIVLLFVGMKCAGKVGKVWLWEWGRKRPWRLVFQQVITVIRQCAELFRFVCENENGTSMYSLLVQHYCLEGDGDQEQRTARVMQETLVYHVGVKIANTIGNAIYPLYRDESGKELEESAFNVMRSSCLEDTRTILTQNGSYGL